MKSKLLWISVGLFILGSCASTNTISNSFITKRKHNKGFHINLNKNKSDVAVNKNSDKKLGRNIEINDPTHINDKSPFSAENSQESFAEVSKKETNVISNEKKGFKSTPIDIILPKKSTKIASPSKSRNLAIQSIQNTNPKFEATNKVKENLKRDSNNANDDTVLIIVLCFLLPPLAVYLFEGRWTSRCTLNLVLTLLCGIPGVIHALIVVLK